MRYDMTKAYKNWVMDSGPYRLSVTITCGIRTSFEKFCKFINIFIRKANLKLFKHGYWEREWLEGFAFFEDHPEGNSINKMHVHMLIKPNARLNDFKLEQLEDIFEKAAKAVVDNGRRVFFAEHMKVQYANHNRHSYLFKQIHDTSLNRIKPVDAKGLSDSGLY